MGHSPFFLCVCQNTEKIKEDMKMLTITVTELLRTELFVL